MSALSGRPEEPSGAGYDGRWCDDNREGNGQLDTDLVHIPHIGVTTYVEEVQWSVWHRRAMLLPTDYADLVLMTNAVPVLLPPAPGLARAAIRGIDGLVVAGGPDVDPSRYGEAPHALTGAPRTVRDQWELELLEAALGLDLPVLAICRGMQLLNVLCGGTLHQHVPDVTGTSTHQPALGTFGDVSAHVEHGSQLHRIVGDRVTVRCHHHQAIARTGRNLRATAFAQDGVVEAFEHDEATFALGVQWHPEEDATDARIFQALRDAAANRMTNTRATKEIA